METSYASHYLYTDRVPKLNTFRESFDQLMNCYNVCEVVVFLNGKEYLRETRDENEFAKNYVYILQPAVLKTSRTIKDMDPTDELITVEIETKKNAITLGVDTDFVIIVRQEAVTKVQKYYERVQERIYIDAKNKPDRLIKKCYPIPKEPRHKREKIKKVQTSFKNKPDKGKRSSTLEIQDVNDEEESHVVEEEDEEEEGEE